MAHFATCPVCSWSEGPFLTVQEAGCALRTHPHPEARIISKGRL